MLRGLVVVSMLTAAVVGGSARSAHADAPKEKTAIIAIDVQSGIPDFLRGKLAAKTTEGLAAAGYDVIAVEPGKLAGQLATCREGACLKKVGEAVGAPTLLVASMSRKDESTIIVYKLFDAPTGEVLAEVHEVCDLCGQQELEERVNVAASSLRVKASAAHRGGGAPAGGSQSSTVTGRVKVAIVPSVAVNLDAARVDALTADLAEALVAELDIDAVGGLEVRRGLPAEGVPPECVTTPSCAADVAKRLDANQILFLVMVGTGNALQVDTTWVEPSSGHHAARPPTDVANMNDAKARFAAVAHALLPDAPVRKKPGGGNGGPGGMMSKEVPRHFTTASYATTAVAVVGVGVGVSLGLVTRSKYNTCDTPTANCEQSKKDSIRLTGLLADGGWVLAIGGAVATSILYATSGESAHLVIAPTESSTGGVGGVTIGALGRF